MDLSGSVPALGATAGKVEATVLPKAVFENRLMRFLSFEPGERSPRLLKLGDESADAKKLRRDKQG